MLVGVERMAGRQVGRQAGGRRADTHNGAGASQCIVSQSLATMHRNSLQQCAAMPTTMRGIACGERERQREVEV